MSDLYVCECQLFFSSTSMKWKGQNWRKNWDWINVVIMVALKVEPSLLPMPPFYCLVPVCCITLTPRSTRVKVLMVQDVPHLAFSHWIHSLFDSPQRVVFDTRWWNMKHLVSRYSPRRLSFSILQNKYVFKPKLLDCLLFIFYLFAQCVCTKVVNLSKTRQTRKHMV